jgi:hypothetical protein
MGAWLAFGLFLQATGYKPPPDPTPTPAPHVISGTFTLVDDDTVANNCTGPSNGNWKNVHPGAEVVVKNRDGWRVGTGSLDEGKATVWGQFGSKACAYAFTVGVPTAESYTIHYPGGLSVDYTFEELQTRDWSIGSACCRFVQGN